MAVDNVDRRIRLMRTPEGLKRLTRNYWREYRPDFYRKLERSGRLEGAVERAVSETLAAFERTEKKLIQDGCTPLQARLRAWDMVCEQWIFVPHEADLPSTKSRKRPSGR
jgi:hypothetical protein